MAVATDGRAVDNGAAIAIGGTVALEALFGGPVTGASMKPARPCGPALASSMWDDVCLRSAGRSQDGARRCSLRRAQGRHEPSRPDDARRARAYTGGRGHAGEAYRPRSSKRPQPLDRARGLTR
ncbi:MAG: aquaporin [Thermoleophilaceae bacterium]|nr:aquaporin [Thermoleophilaceae bacterium]